MYGRVGRGARSTRADARLCTSSGISLYSASLFSPGVVRDCAKHWQRKSGRQGTRAAESYGNSRLSDRPPEERARTDLFEMCSDF